MNASFVAERWSALSHQREVLASTNKCPLINGTEGQLAIVSAKGKHSSVFVFGKEELIELNCEGPGGKIAK